MEKREREREIVSNFKQVKKNRFFFEIVTTNSNKEGYSGGIYVCMLALKWPKLFVEQGNHGVEVRFWKFDTILNFKEGEVDFSLLPTNFEKGHKSNKQFKNGVNINCEHLTW